MAAGPLLTCAHAPSLQHVRAPPQCEALVHLPQVSKVVSHARCCGSVAVAHAWVSLGQQPLSAMQIAPSTRSAQQLLPAPQSLAARLQLAHAWSRQVFCAGQSLASQQVPLVHAPPQHTAPAPHVCVLSQATQVLLAHSCPFVQSAAPQHVAPPMHAPPQHRPPAHAPAVLQVESAHWPLMHKVPAALPEQSVSLQQLPARQALSAEVLVEVLVEVPGAQHTWLLGHTAVVVAPQAVQAWVAGSHTPLPQSLL